MGVTFDPEIEISPTQEQNFLKRCLVRHLLRPLTSIDLGGRRPSPRHPPGARQEFQPRRNIFLRFLSALAENVSHFSAKHLLKQARPLIKKWPESSQSRP